MGGLNPHLGGLPESTTQMASPSVELFFAGLTTVTDRPHYSVVTINRVYVHNTAMQLNIIFMR